MKRKHRIAAVTYNGLCTFEFGIVVEVFGLPRPELDIPWYDFKACAIERSPLEAIGGVTVQAAHGIEGLGWADTIVIPGWRDANEEPPAVLTNAIRNACDRGVRLVSICSGVFVLAAAGVLDGRAATTHWRYVERLQDRFPTVRVDADALYIDEGQILTSAGSAAGLDLCLHIVRRDFGSEIANVVARRLVLPTHREGGQTQFIPKPVDESGRSLAPLLDWLRSTLDTPHTVASMADWICQSERTFQRRFRAATGLSPHAWLTAERVERARELLETTALDVAEIATQSGFVTAETLRHHFRRKLAVSPTRYRSAFGRRSRGNTH